MPRIKKEEQKEENDEELVETEYEEDSDETIEPETEPEPEVKPKRKYNRKPNENIKVKKAVVVKGKSKPKPEKVVYLVQDKDTLDLEELSRPFRKMTKKQATAIEREEEAVKQEIESGKVLVRTKKGVVDRRSKPERTAKQIEATKRLVEMNRLKREHKMKAHNDEVKETVSNTVKEVLGEAIRNPRSLSREKNRPEPVKSEPIDIPSPVKKTRGQLMKDLLG